MARASSSGLLAPWSSGTGRLSPLYGTPLGLKDLSWTAKISSSSFAKDGFVTFARNKSSTACRNGNVPVALGHVCTNMAMSYVGG